MRDSASRTKTLVAVVAAKKGKIRDADEKIW